MSVRNLKDIVYLSTCVLLLWVGCSNTQYENNESVDLDRVEASSESFVNNESFVSFMESIEYGLFRRISDSSAFLNWADFTNCLDTSDRPVYCLSTVTYNRTSNKIDSFGNQLETYMTALRGDFQDMPDSTFLQVFEKSVNLFVLENHSLTKSLPDIKQDSIEGQRCYEMNASNMTGLMITSARGVGVSVVSGSGWAGPNSFLSDIGLSSQYHSEYCDCLRKRYGGGC